MNKKHKLEQELKETLIEGDMQQKEPKTAALQQLYPKYEIRIQTEKDPIREETTLYRKQAKEIDDRYDKYMEHPENDS